jgi:shikimate 5-dehydrogenase
MALGLGFAAANRRRNRIDVVNRDADRRDEQADRLNEQSAVSLADDARPKPTQL